MYPLNASETLQKKKSLKKKLLAQSVNWIEKRVAILGGSTTAEVKDQLEIFLLKNAIKPTFYESEYNQYWEDVMFDNPKLKQFEPEIIYIHTTSKNLTPYKQVKTKEEADALLKVQLGKFEEMWDKIFATYNCYIIQNNFERPPYRLLGNMDISDYRGFSNFISRLNQGMYKYAQTYPNFFVNDIDYLASEFGLSKWLDPKYWYLYKYAMSIEAIPALGFNVANIIKSIYGKNKKAVVTDLDNTLWGGIIGDFGLDCIYMTMDTPMGEAYRELQKYLLNLKDIGVLINVCSKNDYSVALQGIMSDDFLLSPADFVCLEANWDDKHYNVEKIINKLNLNPDSVVFIDDNPVERDIVSENIPAVAVPYFEDIIYFPQHLDKQGYFEVTAITADDLSRTDMYLANTKREQSEASFVNYKDYLKSLNMSAEIKPFKSSVIVRVTQLINKTNQFNLTNKRYGEAEVEQIASSDKCITLYGKLVDKFGDNGIVSAIIAEVKEDSLRIVLWVMSCRVFKREFELAMFDELVAIAKSMGLSSISGKYVPSDTNEIVANLYKNLGFTNYGGVWVFDVSSAEDLCKVISIVR
ncbi:MAG: hypothetical protein ATN34_04605 [Epulopiscium sp. Nele67-Bin002]|nr:MAG: hypothetical protein ATN34_04605 [Epulopiscium sp. Nele67-Bin002]